MGESRRKRHEEAARVAGMWRLGPRAKDPGLLPVPRVLSGAAGTHTPLTTLWEMGFWAAQGKTRQQREWRENGRWEEGCKARLGQVPSPAQEAAEVSDPALPPVWLEAGGKGRSVAAHHHHFRAQMRGQRGSSSPEAKGPHWSDRLCPWSLGLS